MKVNQTMRGLVINDTRGMNGLIIAENQGVHGLFVNDGKVLNGFGDFDGLFVNDGRTLSGYGDVAAPVPTGLSTTAALALAGVNAIASIFLWNTGYKKFAGGLAALTAVGLAYNYSSQSSATAATTAAASTAATVAAATNTAS